MSGRPRQILVVANETVVSRALVELVEQKAAGPVQVTVLAPVNQPRQGYVVYYDTRRAAARRRLEKTLELLRAAGVAADGIVVESDPVSALRDAINQLEPHDDKVVCPECHHHFRREQRLGESSATPLVN